MSGTKNLTGQRFGKWTVVSRAENKNGEVRWNCVCSCERKTEKIVLGRGLKNGEATSCGCKPNPKFINYADKQIGMWAVGVQAGKAPNGHSLWHVTCVGLPGIPCGKKKIVNGTVLKKYKGATGCGCGARTNRIGERHGAWVVDALDPYGGRETRWLCTCDCGTKRSVLDTSFIGGVSKSCGCDDAYKRQPLGESPINVAFSGHLSNAKMRSIENFLTREQYIEIVTQDCAYCGLPPSKVTRARRTPSDTFVRNGVDRRNNEPYYKLENSVPCCEDCNLRKGSKPFDTWMAFLKRLDQAVIRHQQPKR
jgi:hypothetical protein